MQNTFQTIAGFFLIILLLTLANRTRVGHTIVYYSLLLMIIIILLAEAPLYASIVGNLKFSPTSSSGG